MPAYSSTPLALKLGIKAGHRVALIQAPRGFEMLLAGLPDEVSLRRDARAAGLYDVILCFVRARAPLTARLTRLRPRLAPAGGLWVAWPKRASGVQTDLTEGAVRLAGLETGLVDNKICSVDETWSGLRFVIRLHDRPA